MNAPTITKEISIQYLLNRKSFTGDNTVNVKINTLQEAIDKIKVTLTGPDKDFLIRRLP